jgi:hypothetical protein
MRELLTMFYEDHLGVTSSEEEEEGDESDRDGGTGESSDDDASDFSALDKALEESEHFNKDSPWVEFKDDDTGKSYYFNSETEETSWKLPEEGISGYGQDEDTDDDEEDGENDDDDEEGGSGDGEHDSDEPGA